MGEDNHHGASQRNDEHLSNTSHVIDIPTTGRKSSGRSGEVNLAHWPRDPLYQSNGLNTNNNIKEKAIHASHSHQPLLDPYSFFHSHCGGDGSHLDS